MKLPNEYAEKVYAGVLGKIVGVYLGRPIEMWSYEKIMQELGEITYYVNQLVPEKPPLVVTDDDISGTFTFLRALTDYDAGAEITAAMVGQTWLNYLIEERTILWWGGLGNSTEHTAYLRLKNGIPAPQSGSIALNGKTIAEQIGAQIFIDGWAMVSPGNPDVAVKLACKAASVSHDGEAVLAAQVLAAMQSMAFVESDIGTLLEIGVSYLPKDSVIAHTIATVREWHATEPDWHVTREKIAGEYNVEKYRGACHIVPNFAIILLGWLYGDGDFDKSMRIVNTAGFDTDCNAGNLGCLLGIRNGLATFEAQDWRGPVADRLYIPSADGGRAISDAVIESQEIINLGRKIAGESAWEPKNHARFHFEFSGSVQGFHVEEASTTIENVAGHSELGTRSLAIGYQKIGHISTPTFTLPDEFHRQGYQMVASPSLYAGQTISVGVQSGKACTITPFVKVYKKDQDLEMLLGAPTDLVVGETNHLSWVVPDTAGQPIAEVGIRVAGDQGNVYLDWLSWDGAPSINLARPLETSTYKGKFSVWREAWVNAVDSWDTWGAEAYRLVQNHGRGLLIQGTRQWTNYQVEAEITPWLMEAGGIAIRVQGLERYYALTLENNHKLRIAKHLDGKTILGEIPFDWENHIGYRLKLAANENRLRAWVDGRLIFDIVDDSQPLLGGGVAFVIEEGHLSSESMRVFPSE
jgi:ADP-ribosylglycohydrolase